MQINNISSNIYSGDYKKSRVSSFGHKISDKILLEYSVSVYEFENRLKYISTRDFIKTLPNDRLEKLKAFANGKINIHEIIDDYVREVESFNSPKIMQQFQMFIDKLGLRKFVDQENEMAEIYVSDTIDTIRENYPYDACISSKIVGTNVIYEDHHRSGLTEFISSDSSGLARFVNKTEWYLKKIFDEKMTELRELFRQEESKNKKKSLLDELENSLF